MEDFIYILAGVAYLAYSIYSAGQKKKKKLEEAQQQPYVETEVKTSEPSIKKESAPSIFDEILGLQNFEFNSEEELYDEVEEDFVEEEIIDVVPSEEGIRTTKIQSSIELFESQEEESIVQLDEKEKSIDYEFNLRDAIISSEILNPPYIDR